VGSCGRGSPRKHQPAGRTSTFRRPETSARVGPPRKRRSATRTVRPVRGGVLGRRCRPGDHGSDYRKDLENRARGAWQGARGPAAVTARAAQGDLDDQGTLNDDAPVDYNEHATDKTDKSATTARTAKNERCCPRQHGHYGDNRGCCCHSHVVVHVDDVHEAHDDHRAFPPPRALRAPRAAPATAERTGQAGAIADPGTGEQARRQEELVHGHGPNHQGPGHGDHNGGRKDDDHEADYNDWPHYDDGPDYND
jgi:hypothetical protein